MAANPSTQKGLSSPESVGVRKAEEEPALVLPQVATSIRGQAAVGALPRTPNNDAFLSPLPLPTPQMTLGPVSPPTPPLQELRVETLEGSVGGCLQRHLEAWRELGDKTTLEWVEHGYIPQFKEMPPVTRDWQRFESAHSHLLQQVLEEQVTTLLEKKP